MKLGILRTYMHYSKKGKYCISSKLTLTYEKLDYLNALLQFDENERINMEDMVQHPFLKKKFEEQKSVLISSLINGEDTELQLNTNERRNYLGTGKSFGYGNLDSLKALDESVLVNDKNIDMIFEIDSKVRIRIKEREEDGFIIIETEKIMS